MYLFYAENGINCVFISVMHFSEHDGISFVLFLCRIKFHKGEIDGLRHAHGTETYLSTEPLKY